MSDGEPHATTGLHTSSDGALSTDDGTSLPDCCESGACRCACLHHGQFAPMTMVASAAIIGHTDRVRPMFSVHASPALPHLIRPPNGQPSLGSGMHRSPVRTPAPDLPACPQPALRPKTRPEG